MGHKLVKSEPVPPTICRDCGRSEEPDKFLDKYHKTKLGFKVYYPNCKRCRDDSAIERVRNWKKLNPDKKYIRNGCPSSHYEYQRWKFIKSTYGLEKHDFEFMVERQGGRCAICRSEFENSKKTHIDHCHETGQIRGVLCSRCNHGLGHFKDNIDNLLRAVSYLAKTRLTQEEF